MRALEIAAALPGRFRWLDHGNPYHCHDFGIGEAIAALAASSAEAGGAAAIGSAAADAAVTSGLAGAEAFGGAAAGLESVGGTAAATASGFSLPSLSTIGQVASVGGTLLQAKGVSDQAAYQEALGRRESEALQQKAGQDAAAAERQQITQERKTDLVLSRARALSAASGGGATDPTIINNEGQIAQQGEYNALSALYEGQAASRADRYQADIDLFKGQQAAAAAPLAIGGTLLSGLSSFAANRAQLRYYTRVGGAPYFSGV